MASAGKSKKFALGSIYDQGHFLLGRSSTEGAERIKVLLADFEAGVITPDEALGTLRVVVRELLEKP